MKKYPDITPLIKKKDEHRRRMASLPFEEKVKIAFNLNTRHKFIKSGRLVPSTESEGRTTREPPKSDNVSHIMNKAKLKSYAPQARRDFREAVLARAVALGLSPDAKATVEVSGDVAIINGQAHPRGMAVLREGLIERITQQGWEQLIEEIAYTWFNRFTALRFMELHGYLPHGLRVLSNPDDSKDEPELLEKAHTLELPGLARERVVELKLAANKDAELYRLLLVAQCNSLSAAMPFLFERINDETELLLPDNLLHTDSVIRKLVREIDEEDWSQVEIIGWLYQFYISERKDEVIGKVVKSEDIPAATQLFTPNWIVKYMTQNSLGRMWLQTYPDSPLQAKMEYYIEPAKQSEEVKRELAKLTRWSINPEEIKILDPACGSGHILVEAYDLLEEIYRERGYSSRDIPRLILEKNLYGLDIDERAAQLASFALLMKARAGDRRVLEENAPRLNILAIPESSHLNAKGLVAALLTKREPKRGGPIRADPALFADAQAQPSLSMAEEVQKETGSKSEEVTRDEVVKLLNLFSQGKTLGSLIVVPDEMRWTVVTLKHVVASKMASPELMERTAAEQIAPFIRAAQMLAQEYDCVIANPPYMGSKFYNASLKDFINKTYPEGKADLYGCFTLRNLELCRKGGRVAMLTIPNWMFLSTFEPLRESLLNNSYIETLVHNGRGVFGSDFGTCAYTIAKEQNTNKKGAFKRLFDVQGSVASNEELNRRFFEVGIFTASSDDFKKIQGCPIAYWVSDKVREVFEKGTPLGEIASIQVGLQTSNNGRFTRLWFEVSERNSSYNCENSSQAVDSNKTWFSYNKGGDFRKWYGNKEYVVNWKNNGDEIKRYVAEKYPYLNGNVDYVVKDRGFFFKAGVTWSFISSSNFGVRYTDEGSVFDVAGSTAFPNQPYMNLVTGFLCTTQAFDFMKAMNPTLNFQAGNVAALPILEKEVEGIKPQVDAIVEEAVAIARTDWDSFETSWNFQSLPLLRPDVEASTVEESFTNWQALCNANIRRMQELETNNNRLFIEAYGLQNELSPEVLEEQITLARADKSDDTRRLCSYAVGCMMGRYDLNEPGLVYANSGGAGFDPSRYRTFAADADGIIPVTDLEWFDDDAASRFSEFVRLAWSLDTHGQNLAWIAAQLGGKSSEMPVETIRRYFSSQFFKDHLQTYKKRPIYWLFSSGKQKAFECLVYLHRYNESTLSRIRTEYVTPLFGKLSGRIEYIGGADGQGGLIGAATSTPEKNKLRKQLEVLKKKETELVAFDDQLRHHADMRIKLDLDDGVKINYGKFGDLLAEVRAVSGGSAE